MLDEAPMNPNPQFFSSLGECFIPAYVKEALTNGTKNINELYEFDENAFDGGYQAQVYRGNNCCNIRIRFTLKEFSHIKVDT